MLPYIWENINLKWEMAMSKEANIQDPKLDQAINQQAEQIKTI